MRKTVAVAVKELRQAARDPLSLTMLLVLPAALLLLYGFALNFDVRHVALAVQDRDLSSESRDLLAAFVNSTYFELVAVLPAGEDPEALTARRVAKAVLVIPEGFASDLRSGRGAQVQLLVDGADAGTATTLLGYARTLVAEANRARLRNVAISLLGHPPTAISWNPRVWYNPELQSTRFLVPGLIGFLLMLTAVLSTALSVVREKERGTLEQLRVAPINTFQVILGKTLPYLGISLLATLIILLAARALFGVEVRGSYVDLFLVTLLYLVGALGLGLLISTIAETQAHAFQIGLLVSLLPSVLLSGFIFQIRIMPLPLQAVTYLVPARYFLVALRGIILKGASLAPYWDQLLYLAIFCAVVLALASWRLARQEG